MKNDENYVLTLTRDQALVARDALELYARLKFGQFNTITEKILPIGDDIHDYCERRDAANDILRVAACTIFGSDAYRRPKVARDEVSDRAWVIYAAIRHCIAWHDHPEGGFGVSFDEPFSLGNEPIPKCEVKDK